MPVSSHHTGRALTSPRFSVTLHSTIIAALFRDCIFSHQNQACYPTPPDTGWVA